jgi:hypothetical protein
MAPNLTPRHRQINLKSPEMAPGSGKFAYSDADSIGGIAIEFLWNFK